MNKKMRQQKTKINTVRLVPFLITFTCITFLSLNAFSQNEDLQKKRDNKREHIKNQKRTYISEKMNLAEDKAQLFWPVYDEFEAEKEKLHKERRELKKIKKSKNELTDLEMEEHINKHLNMKLKSANLDKKYYDKFKKVLSVQDIGKLYEAQEQFKKELLKKLKNHRPEGSPPIER